MVLCSTWFQVLCAAAHPDVRVVNQVGQASHVGLLQVAMSSGDFGTVCGLNAAGADVACKQLGYDYGVVSPSACTMYGGAGLCGAAGSPVAIKNLKCSGAEMSLGECESEAADDACQSHTSDAVVFCGLLDKPGFADGELRLIGLDGAPALPHEAGRLEMYLADANVWAPVCKEGFTSGSASVACRAMSFSSSAGFAGCEGSLCGVVAPEVSDLACSGSEPSVRQCPMSRGDSVFCAPEESVVVTCAGAGNPIGVLVDV